MEVAGGGVLKGSVHCLALGYSTSPRGTLYSTRYPAALHTVEGKDQKLSGSPGGDLPLVSVDISLHPHCTPGRARFYSTLMGEGHVRCCKTTQEME